MPDILQWRDIAPSFRDSILLGNGASIAVDPNFAYGSLSAAAREHGHLTPPVAHIFEQFGVEDFELVLRRLWQATLVNQALGIPNGPVEAAYHEVRTALVATIRDTHVTYDDARPHLEPIYRFLQQFKTVLSLNYDLILYWATRISEEALGRWFKDCFVGGAFREDWQTMREPYRADGATLFFYPHGNLVLTRTQNGSESKVTAGFDNLLNSILNCWEDESVVPLFVCEGTADHKKKAIESSSYLHRVFREILPCLGDSLAIYGWSLSEQDQHILEQIKRRPPLRVAVSVYGADDAFIQRVDEKLQVAGVREIYFYDANSPGCWNNVADDLQGT